MFCDAGYKTEKSLHLALYPRMVGINVIKRHIFKTTQR
ncbi:hypothetical protein BN135_3319 [Cronobacter muytjensii 530]